MRIGGLEISPPVLLAPMAGVADAPFRQICREMGCPAAVTEMISAKALYYASRGTERLLAREDGPGLLGVGCGDYVGTQVPVGEHNPFGVSGSP